MITNTQCLSQREEILQLIAVNTLEKAEERIRDWEAILVSSTDLGTDEQFIMFTTLAIFYRKIRQYDKSANYSRQASYLVKKVDQVPIRIIIDAYMNYSGLEREYGQFQHARVLLATLLDLLDSKNFHDHFVFGLIYSNLGKVFLAEEDVENGIRQMEKALTYYRKAVPETHPATVQMIHAISDIHIHMENYRKALEIQQQLQEAYQKEKDQMNAGKTLLKMAEIYFYIDLKAARETIKRAISLLEEMHEKTHIDLSRANLMLAELDENMGDFRRAILYYKRSLELLESFCKDEHFMIVFTYSKIGTLSLEIEAFDEAQDYLEKGLVLSNGFPKFKVQFLYALGKLYSEIKQYDQAFSVFQAFLQSLEKDDRKKSKAYANTLQAIADNFLQQEKLDDACHYYEKAITIYEQIAPECNMENGLACIQLAHCYEDKQHSDLKKAELFFEKGYNSLSTLRHNELLKETLIEIIAFFTRIRNQFKQKEYADKLVRLQREI